MCVCVMGVQKPQWFLRKLHWSWALRMAKWRVVVCLRLRKKHKLYQSPEVRGSTGDSTNRKCAFGEWNPEKRTVIDWDWPRRACRSLIIQEYTDQVEKEMATHSSILAWRIPGTEEPAGLPTVGSRRVRHNWSDLAAAATYRSSINMEFCPG